MKLSLQFPLHTQSENEYRGQAFAIAQLPRHKQIDAAHGIDRARRKQRAEVRLFLDSQLPKLRSRFASGANFFRVTLVRISLGVLDEGNLWGALKGVQDEVADWLGVDDGDRHAASWKVAQQQGPKGYHAVRVEIEDDDPDPREVHKVLGPLPAKLGPILGDCAHCGRPALPEPLTPAAKRAARKRVVAEQKALVFRRAFYALPEEQTEEEEVLHELEGLGDAPPERLTVRRKDGSVALWRTLFKHEELGEIWLYEVPPVAAE